MKIADISSIQSCIHSSYTQTHLHHCNTRGRAREAQQRWEAPEPRTAIHQADVWDRVCKQQGPGYKSLQCNWTALSSDPEVTTTLLQVTQLGTASVSTHSLPSLKHTGITQTWEQFSMSFVNTSLYQQAAGCRSCRKGLCPEVCILQYSHISLHPSPTREEPDTNPQILLYPNTSLLSLAFIQQSLSVPIQSPCIQFTTKPKLQTELTVCPCPTAHRGQVKLQGQSSSHQEIQQSTKAH